VVNAASVVFWVSVALVAYTFVLFPLILWAREKWFRRPVRRAEITPTITLLVVAHNEAEVIRQRIENILALDYPRDRINVLIVSDGSDDGTLEIVSEYAATGVNLLALPRVGKIAALNAGVARATGDIVVFSDANTICALDSIRKLVQPFADPTVGGVAGNQQYTLDDQPNATASGEITYWGFDQALKLWQSASGSITTTTGALYAARRSLLQAVPKSVADDAVISFRVVASGHRLVYEPAAVAFEPVAPNPAAEFRRKVRVIALGMKSVLAVSELISPMKHGFFSLQLVSHKLLRWMAVWMFLAIFVSSLVLAPTSIFFALVLAFQCCFYGAAAVVWIANSLLRSKSGLPPLLTVPYFFCLTYAASLRAQWMVVTGSPLDRWNVVRDRTTLKQDAPTRESVAYIMSRFPKVTETFILYEILELERRGESVGIYPLIRQREKVEHPEAAAAVARAHYSPVLSLDIIAANLRCIWRQPITYLRTLREALTGTFGSANFLAGALAFFPKSIAFAERMERAGIRHIHAHFATHPALSALIVHRLTGIPFSFTAHGHDVHCDRRMLAEKLEAASFAVAISRYNRNLMAEECGVEYFDKTHVVHCGVDTSFFRPGAASDPSGSLRLMMVASFWEVKGHAYLIQACKLLRERGLAFECDLIGDGDLKQEVLRQIADAGLQDAFRLHGPQPRNVVRELLHQAHVKVLPSVPTSNGLREGIPVALMEAMACGIPVVSSFLSGIPELVDNGVSGILVPPRDVLGLADALEQMARNPEMRVRMGKAGREKILREFDLATNAQVLARLFTKGAIGETEPEKPIAA
jgi:colanic acid/amylovoran biosynthesis glycosyltransferase